MTTQSDKAMTLNTFYLFRKVIKTNLKCSIFLLALFAFGGCASKPDTQIFYDESINFEEYKTVSWHPQTPVDTSEFSGKLPLILQNKIMQEAENIITERGLKFLATPENADLIVRVTVGKRSQLNIRKERIQTYDEVALVTHTGPRGRFFIQQGAYIPGDVETFDVIEQYTEGSLAIDFYDNSTNKPVWSGHIKNEVDMSLAPKTRQERIKIAVIEMMKDFPPQ